MNRKPKAKDVSKSAPQPADRKTPVKVPHVVDITGGIEPLPLPRAVRVPADRLI